MLKVQRHIQSRLLTQQNVFNLYMHEYQAYDLLKRYQVPLVPVLIMLSRAIGPVPQKTPWPLLKESCLKPAKLNLLLMSLSRLRSTPEEEAKASSKNHPLKEVCRLPPSLRKSTITLRKC